MQTAKSLFIALLVGTLCGCGTREPVAETEIAARLTAAIRDASLARHPDGPVRRFNQGKSLGCVTATFAVAPQLPPELQQGVFQPGKTYPARVRFSSASEWDDAKKDFRGMSIKLAEVVGKPLWGEAGTQDFLLNSHPALFAGTPEHFLEFVEAARDDAVWRYFINPRHFYSLRIVLQGRDSIASPFDIRYWSTTPYRFGDAGAVVKYSTRPCSHGISAMPAQPGPDHLSAAMKTHLQRGEACFDFMIQVRGDPDAMPIEDAAVAWDENAAPFRKVATLTIKEQDFQSPAATQACEAMSFNPWQSLAAHEPLGGINRVRQPIYAEIGKFRADENRRRGLTP